MVVDIESVLNFFKLAFVGIVKLKKIVEINKIANDCVISQKVHDVLVNDSQIFFFIFLLILENEVVKEYLVELVDGFLNAKFDSLNG